MLLRRVGIENIANLVGHGGHFVCSASFEKRSLTIPLQFAADVFDSVVICENINHAELHQGHGATLRDHFGANCRMAWLNTDNPLETGDSLFGGIADLARDSSQRIVVDISTFTHESLLMLLRVLYITRQCVNVTLLYSKATEYSIGDRPENKWLSKGVGEIRSVLGFPGRVYPSRALHLIVLVGLEYQRTIDIVGRYEPTEISLGYGRTGDLPSTDDIGHHGFWKVHAIYEGAREFTFSPLDPIAARRKISDQVKRTDGYNVIVAPMNTKLSTIAAGLVACENDNVQLCYAKALVYNYHNYSRPGEEVFVVELEGEDRDNL